MDYFYNLSDLKEILDEAMWEYDTEKNDYALHEFWEEVLSEVVESDEIGYAWVCTGRNAVLEYVNWFYHTAMTDDPVAIGEALWQRLHHEIYPSDTALIQLNEIERVLAVVNELFPFSEKLIKEQFLTICIIDDTIKGRNGEATAYVDGKSAEGGIFLYRMWSDLGRNFTPSTVLLHELGHQLHIYLTKTLDTVPESFKIYLSEIGTDPASLSNDDLLEVFADTFLLAIVYKTKEFGDPFPDIDEDTKELCYTYIKMLLDQLP